MTIYVDQLIATGHCKMWADTADEMHMAARRAGIEREWFAAHTGFDHYICNPTRRKALIRHGAVTVGRDGAWRWQTLDWLQNGSPDARAIACERIRKHGPRDDLFGPLL